MSQPVWLVTGASGGIGAALVEKLVARSAIVIATDRAEVLPQSPPGGLALPLDVTSAEEIEAVLTSVQQRWGRLDVVVNNAGIGLGGPVEETDDSLAQRAFAINTLGPIALTRAALPLLRRQGKGHLIYTSSDSGVVGLPFQAIYGATKAALECFAESLCHEVHPFGIAVTLIQPCGAIRTGMLERTIDEALARLPKDSPYRPLGENLAEAMMHAGAHGCPPGVIADAMLEAADSPRPPLRIRAGIEERKQMLELRRSMPDEEFLALVRQTLAKK